MDDGSARGYLFKDLEASTIALSQFEFDRCRFQATRLNSLEIDHCFFVDCAIAASDLMSLKADNSSLIRVEMHDSRLTGLTWASGSVRDLRVWSSKGDLSSFRFSKLRSVVFEECELAQADFQDTELRSVQFVNCNLSGAQFSNADMQDVTFDGCTLQGVGGVSSFRGARIRPHDLFSMTRTLAADIGIVVLDD